MEYSRYGQVAREASRTGVAKVVMEGPTVYLRENPRYHSQAWGDPTFRNGWEIVHDLSQMLERNLGREAVGHYVLIDDSFGNPQNFRREMWRPKSDNIVAGLRVHMGLHGFLDNIEQVRMESEFAGSAFHLDPYSSIDASFQLVKFQDNMDRLGGLRVVIVHPDSYQLQQQKMLSHLLGQMRRSGSFNWLTKEDRRELIETSFRHIWIGPRGEEVGVTRPKWNREVGLFEFTPLESN